MRPWLRGGGNLRGIRGWRYLAQTSIDSWTRRLTRLHLILILLLLFLYFLQGCPARAFVFPDRDSLRGCPEPVLPTFPGKRNFARPQPVQVTAPMQVRKSGMDGEDVCAVRCLRKKFSAYSAVFSDRLSKKKEKKSYHFSRAYCVARLLRLLNYYVM